MEECWMRMLEPYQKYEISSFGRVRNFKNGRIRKLAPSKNHGYIEASFMDAFGARRNLRVHRLVARHFLPESFSENLVVNHKNGLRSDNRVENLECVSIAQNNEHARQMRRPVNNKSVAVEQYSLDGELIAVFESVKAAPFPSPGIVSVCRGNRKTAYGFVWKYAGEQISGEEWRAIEFAGKTVEVSNFGRIKTSRGIRIGRDGIYRTVVLNGKQAGVHRLVALGFVANDDPKSKIWVNHIDFNKHNNCASNLEWVSELENAQHAAVLKRGRLLIAAFRPVIGVHTQTGEIVRFASVGDAGKFFSNDPQGSYVSAACNGRVKAAYGYAWRHDDKCY